jgi:hypothetical protein
MAKRKHAAKPQITLCARVDSYDVRSSIGFNVFLLGRIRNDVEEDAEVFDSTTQLIVRGIFSEPKDRSGERIELTLYGQRTGRTTLRVKDVHSRDKDGSRLYRTYRGESAPELDLPTGVTTIQRRRDDHVWSAWVFVEPRLVTDMLITLTSGRSTFLSLYEKRVDRERWVTSVSLQTADPAVEEG